MNYQYDFTLHPQWLKVTVYVGLDSEFKLAFPHLWTGADQAELWFPPGSLPPTHSDIAHEGVHLVTWGVESLSPSEYDALVPRRDMARTKGRGAVREEAMARMMDRYIDTFYRQADEHGLVVVGPKVPVADMKFILR